MLDPLAWMVTVLLVGPPLLFGLIILAGGLVALTAALLPRRAHRVTATFPCPWMGWVVTADFLVRAAAAQPSDVVACTVFPDPLRITCEKPCLAGTASARYQVEASRHAE